MHARVILCWLVMVAPAVAADLTDFRVRSVAWEHTLGTFVGPDSKPKTNILSVQMEVPADFLRVSRAARVIVTEAVDADGHPLTQQEAPPFFHTSVGRVDGDSAMITAREPLGFSLRTTSQPTRVKQIDGFVEAVVPSMDARSEIRVVALRARFGAPLPASILSQLGVSITLLAPGEEATEFSAGLKRLQEMGLRLPDDAFKVPPDHLGVVILDPRQRVAGWQFERRDGGPLRYNHNGDSHFEAEPGRRFDLYGIRSSDIDHAAFVCWLITDRSLVRYPLHLTDIIVDPR